MRSFILTFVMLMLSVSNVMAESAVRDTSFSSDGYDLSSTITSFVGVAQTSAADGGKLLVVGSPTAKDKILISKYTPTGAIDTGFGTVGVASIATTDIDSAYSTATVQGMHYNSDGSFLVYGYSGDKGFIVKIGANGSLIWAHPAVVDFSPNKVLVNDVAVGSDGKIYALVDLRNDSGDLTGFCYLKAFNADGSAVGDWGGDEKGYSGLIGKTMLIDDSNIIVGGQSTSNNLIAFCYFKVSDGDALSTIYHPDNIGLQSTTRSCCNDLVKDSTGMYACGYDGDNTFVVKLLGINAADDEWGLHGLVELKPDNTASTLNKLHITADGVIATGTTSDNYFLTIRIDNSGTLDTALNGSGYTTVSPGSACECFDSLIQTDGKVVLVGSSDGKGAIERINTDTQAPSVASVLPASAATGIAINSKITVTFSGNIDSSTVTDTNVKVTEAVSGDAVSGTLSCQDKTITFTPDADLKATTEYKVELKTGIKGTNGVALGSAYTWNFTTNSGVDTTKPSVASCSIADNESGVDASAHFSIVFSEDMDPATITAKNILLAGGEPCTVAYDQSSQTATVTPVAAFVAGSRNVLIVTTDAKDTVGNSLNERTTWRFSVADDPSDTDHDGVPDSIDHFPNDSKHVSLPAVTDGQTIELEVPEAQANILRGVKSVDASSDSVNQENKPEGVDFNWGLLSYQIVTAAVGDTVQVTLTLPNATMGNLHVYKTGVGGFSEFPDATINNGVVTLTLQDGGAGDDDGVANGIIVDPVGVGVSGSSSSSSGSSSGCVLNPSAGFGIDMLGMFVIGLFGIVMRRFRK